MSAPVPRSTRRADLCSGEHARRVAVRLFETGHEDISIVRTSNPLQPLRVLRSADVLDRSAEIVVVTS
jgi:hypothetical protein